MTPFLVWFPFCASCFVRFSVSGFFCSFSSWLISDENHVSMHENFSSSRFDQYLELVLLQYLFDSVTLYVLCMILCLEVTVNHPRRNPNLGFASSDLGARLEPHHVCARTLHTTSYHEKNRHHLKTHKIPSSIAIKKYRLRR